MLVRVMAPCSTCKSRPYLGIGQGISRSGKTLHWLDIVVREEGYAIHDLVCVNCGERTVTAGDCINAI